MKERMTTGPLVVLEMPLVVRHLVPTVPGAGPRKDRYPVFSSTTSALAEEIQGGSIMPAAQTTRTRH
jgi:hypothetical protein